MANFLLIAKFILLVWYKVKYKIITIIVLLIGGSFLIQNDMPLPGILLLVLSTFIVFMLYFEDNDIKTGGFYTIHQIDYRDVKLIKGSFVGLYALIIFMIILVLNYSLEGNLRYPIVTAISIVFCYLLFFSLFEIKTFLILKMFLSYFILSILFLLHIFLYSKYILQITVDIFILIVYLLIRNYAKSHQF